MAYLAPLKPIGIILVHRPTHAHPDAASVNQGVYITSNKVRSLRTIRTVALATGSNRIQREDNVAWNTPCAGIRSAGIQKSELCVVFEDWGQGPVVVLIYFAQSQRQQSDLAAVRAVRMGQHRRGRRRREKRPKLVRAVHAKIHSTPHRRPHAVMMSLLFVLSDESFLCSFRNNKLPTGI